MPRRLIRWCAALLTLVAVAAAAPAPSAPSPSADLCATADAYVENGNLTEAAALYTPDAGEAPLTCSARGLKDVSDQRKEAREVAAEGQKKLRGGKQDEARNKFNEALKLDVKNTQAIAGLAEIDAQKRRPAERRWSRFYNDWIIPALQLIVPFLIAFAVLLSLSGLLTRWLVKVDSPAWPRELRKPLGIVAGVLLAGTAAMLPVYAMFPFEPETLVPWPTFLALLALLLTALFSVMGADMWSRKKKWRHICSWRHWSRFLLSMGCLGAAALLIATLLPDDPERKQYCLLTAYVLLAAYAVLLAATVHGQNLRLQVVVQTAEGKTDAAATDYLLARIQTLGAESPPRLRMHSSTNSSPLSTVQSEDLSALPAGRIIAALSALFFALRPDLTWRARVSIVDANRVAVTLSRNGNHAASDIFSRLDMGLPPVVEAATDEGAANGHRLRAQLLTGAAAFILVQLSEVHEWLQKGLYSARSWKSVTLHVIAASAALIDDADQRITLLARAVNEDPQYPLARLEYLWALQGATQIGELAYRQFADALDSELKQLHLPKRSPLLMRALYRSAAQRINLHAADGYPPNGRNLVAAAAAADTFWAQCEKDHTGIAQWDRFAEQVTPIASVMLRQIEALQLPIGPLPPPADSTVMPRLAYENACLDCFLERRGAARPEDAIQQLRFALPNERDKEEARQDPCLSSLSKRDDFRALVKPSSPRDKIRRQAVWYRSK